MWFLIKTSMVFGFGLVALSYFGGQPATQDTSARNELQLIDAFSAASGAYSYVSGLCSEKPEVCAKGAETFTALAVRAKDGARVAYEFLDSQLADTGTATPAATLPAPAKTASVEAPAQPMPPKVADAAAAHADGVVTGTIPLPQRRPER